MAYHMEGGVMVFTPTIEEFRDFPRFISYMEDNGAQRYGAAKVIPPKEWCPCRNYDDVKDFNISTPISQFVTGQQGVYQLFNIQKKGLSFTQFKEMANSDRYKPPEVKDNEELERKYWKNITFNQPLYGADIPGSLYDKDVTEWNINRLGTILDTVSEEYGVSIPGVNTAYMYFGMWKTSFAWHTEDMDLYSINYLHFGASKQWYVIPPAHAERLERLAKTLFPEYFEQCPSFLRHKMSVISPSVLKQHSIPFGKIVQQEGQFVVTFPCGYHAGFNQGLNCAESTNFASVRWINYGKKATRCVCNNDMVKIDMDVFVRKFQPELWETYCREKELKLLSSKRKEHSRKSIVAGTKRTRLLEVPSEASPTKKSKVKEEIEEEEEEDEDIDEETELDWTMRFNRLWQFQRCDFKVEQAFNQLMSCGGTQCCVCILFVSPSPFQLYDARRLKSSVKCLMARETSARKKFGNDGLKVAVQRSSIQLPASLSHLNNLTDEEEEGSQLLTCSMCGITVHHSCYGVSDLPINPRKWLCRRCEVKAWHAECCLCVLRGGALKPTDNPSGQWAHVVCAVTIPDIVFGCTELKEPVVLSSLTRSRQRIKCSFCVSSPISDNKGKGGVCVQCVWPKCGSTFHVTCAHYQGLVPQQLGGKSGYVCGKHSMEGCIQPVIINTGDEVYAKTNSSRVRYDHGHVTSVDELRSFEVQFDDGTMCSDMARSDLICSEDPILGSEIRVKWSKREIYSARVIGFTTVPQYVVEFDDGAENVLTEEYIYSIHEPLPRKIRDSLKRRSNGRLKSSPPATKS